MIPRIGTGMHAAASGPLIMAAFRVGAHLQCTPGQAVQVTARDHGIAEKFRTEGDGGGAGA